MLRGGTVKGEGCIMATVGGFDWSKFSKSLKKQRAKTKGKKTGSGQKSNAWRDYVSGGKKR
jgi:hypothetical protein